MISIKQEINEVAEKHNMIFQQQSGRINNAKAYRFIDSETGKIIIKDCSIFDSYRICTL